MPEGTTVSPFQHICCKDIEKTSSNSGEYKCQASYESKYEITTDESKFLEIVTVDSLSGDVYFINQMTRLLTAAFRTPNFPDESYFNLET